MGNLGYARGPTVVSPLRLAFVYYYIRYTSGAKARQSLKLGGVNILKFYVITSKDMNSVTDETCKTTMQFSNSLT